jgi:hypothetical protein
MSGAATILASTAVAKSTRVCILYQMILYTPLSIAAMVLLCLYSIGQS